LSFSLRPYQQDIIAETRGKLRVHNSVLVQAPTGSGKTALAAYMLGSAAQKQRRSWFICHRAELVEQTALTFEKVGIQYGIIAAGFPLNPYMPVQICSIDTIKGRLGRYQLPDLIVWDEAHHTAAAGWRRVKEANPQAKHVGLSATPERLDGKGLDELFEAIVQGPPVGWLIEQGYLANYRAFAPPGPNMGNVHTRMGDFVRGENEAVMDKPTITGDAIRHYLRHANGKQAVAFCVSIKHSQHVAAEFRAAGVSAVHLDGTMTSADRKRAVQAFRRGEIKVMTNVDLFGEGFDLPSLEVSILLRPTQSLALYLQQVGRCLRPDAGKDRALILDHAGNMARHGLPDDVREWSLEGRKKKAKAADSEADVAIRQCPKCYAAHRPAGKCPECGHVYAVVSRQPETVDAELVEVDVEAARQRRVLENKQADSLAALIELGKARGYRSEILWAAHYHKARKGDKATLNELVAYASGQGKDPVSATKWAASVMSAVMRK
jgi:DNA repair protein RadD